MTPRERAERALTLDAEGTPGPWAVFDSCSWRRIGTESPDADLHGTLVIEPTVHHRDNHPDLVFRTEGDKALVTEGRGLLPQLAQDLLEALEEIDRLNRLRKAEQG